MITVSEIHLDWQGPVTEDNCREDTAGGGRATNPSVCQGRDTVGSHRLGLSKLTTEPNQWSSAELGHGIPKRSSIPYNIPQTWTCGLFLNPTYDGDPTANLVKALYLSP